MLDWWSGVIAYDASGLKSDIVYRVDPNGLEIWQSPCWVEARGSYETSIQLRRRGAAAGIVLPGDGFGEGKASRELLQMSGNPVKYLQGHNVFGPSVSLLLPIIRATVRSLPKGVKPRDADDDRWPAIKSSRVDQAVVIEMGSHEDVHQWLRSVSTASRSRHGRALVSGDTVYWGMHSRRWTMKGYCKSCELREHPVADLRLNEQFREYSRDQLRLELTLRTPELKDKGTLEEPLFWDYFERIQIGEFDMARVKKLDSLPNGTQLCFFKWMGGAEVRYLYPKRTFYYHRRIILDEVGIDISIPHQDQESTLQHIKYDGKYLREHEIKMPPGFLQGWLFKPEPCPSFSKS